MIEKTASIETLGLSKRALKVLQENNITTFEQLANRYFSSTNGIRLKGCGKAMRDELQFVVLKGCDLFAQ